MKYEGSTVGFAMKIGFADLSYAVYYQLCIYVLIQVWKDKQHQFHPDQKLIIIIAVEQDGNIYRYIM